MFQSIVNFAQRVLTHSPKEKIEFEELVSTSYGEVIRFHAYHGNAANIIYHLVSGMDSQRNVVDAKRSLLTPKQLLSYRLYGTLASDQHILQHIFEVQTACAVIMNEKTGEALISDPLRYSKIGDIINHIFITNTLRHGSLKIPDDMYYDIRSHDAYIISPQHLHSLNFQGDSSLKLRESLVDYLVEGDIELKAATIRLFNLKHDSLSSTAYAHGFEFELPPNFYSGLRLLTISSSPLCNFSAKNSLMTKSYFIGEALTNI